MSNAKGLASVVTNGVRLVGDLALPGASQLLDGHIGEGIGRTIAGFAARALMGPVGWLLVAADSYSKTTTGRGVFHDLYR
ncbi:MAG: hypothetical protein KC636_06525 [Myxococcales bacterium]|nr:hypothetical protein [Myxococcales bacterium]